MPRVTVLTAVYNGERFLEEAIESVLAQTFGDFEFLVVDDGSQDATPELLARYAARDERIRVLRNKPNQGQTPSLNRGLESAEAPYIARLDADDLCLPERLEAQTRFLDDHPAVGLLGSCTEVMDEEGNVLDRLTAPRGDAMHRARLLFNNTFMHSAVMFRKELAFEAGLYDAELEKADLFQDYDLWCRMAPLTRMDSHPATLVRWRRGQGLSLTHKEAQLQGAREISLRAVQRQMGEKKLDADAFRRFWWAYHREAPERLEPGDIAKLQALWEVLGAVPAAAQAFGAGMGRLGLQLLTVGQTAEGQALLRQTARRFGIHVPWRERMKARIRAALRR